uniref:LysR family transcriptional regulator n=1 Tax=Novispirillum itersonii TaxID=189 RepID=UPI001B7F7F36
MNFEILDLRAFLAVLETGSFHKAAEVLHLSQPALSRRIKSLEESLGAPLLERTTRRVSPSAVGRQLQPLLVRLIDELESTVLAMNETGNRQQGLVSIACVPTAAFYFLPRVIRQFRDQHPQIRFRILDLSAREGLQSVASGETEFGISMLGSSDPDVHFTPLMEDPFVLACHRDHPLAKRKTLTWPDLAGYPLIGVSRHSGNRTILDNALAHADVRLDWFYEVNHLSTSLGLVEAGIGISVLPRLATPQTDHPLIVTRPITGPVVERTIGIVERRNGRLSPAAARFKTMLLDSWGGSKGDVPGA